MANVTKPLTHTEVDRAKSKEKEYNLADGRGLFLRIRPSGSKMWLFNYSAPFTKKRKNISLGLYPDVSLADARTQAASYRELLAAKQDPKAYREQQQLIKQGIANNTFERIVYQWFEVKETKVTKAYSEDIIRSFKLHVFPGLGQFPLEEITAPLAIKVIKPIAAKGSLETVRRLCQRINEVMTYAVNTGLLKSNPLAGISEAFQAPIKKNMPALKPAQLPQLMASLNKASIKLTTRCLIEWQLHTMVRPSEAAGARWEEIDFEARLWNIPAARMKKPRPHTVPLSPQAMALLETMKPISESREHIFPADRNPGKHINEQTANMALKRMGYQGQLVAHGLRSIASTTLNEQGFDPDVIEAALAHVDKDEVRRAYNRTDYLEKRKVTMAWWSEHIEQAAMGRSTLAAAGNIVAFTGT